MWVKGFDYFRHNILFTECACIPLNAFYTYLGHSPRQYYFNKSKMYLLTSKNMRVKLLEFSRSHCKTVGDFQAKKTSSLETGRVLHGFRIIWGEPMWS